MNDSDPSRDLHPEPSGEGPVTPVSRARLAGVLLVLTLINVVNVMDRSLISVLAEPIKRAFALSDTQLGILAGLAFALVYGFLALPVSRIADRGLYRPVIMICLAVWSTLTTLGGFSQSFLQLAALRFGVAAGEAGLNPASHALISKLYPPERRGMAIGVFSLGVPIGVAAGAILAGTIAGAHGWRAAFLVIGPIGLLSIPLLLVLPRFHVAPKPKSPVAWGEAFGLLAHPTFLKVWSACALASMFSFGAGAFVGPFYVRVHHMSVAQVGVVFGLTAMIGTGSGAFLGGVVFDAVKRRWSGLELAPSVLALVLSAGCALTAFLTPNLTLSIAALTLALFCYGLTAVPAMTMAQNLAPPDRRAGASALMGISTGVVGATCGPLLIGLLSDAFAARDPAHALIHALCSLPVALLGGALAFYLGSRDLRRA
jgi:predicted MFS family arabinose efflux permease